MRITPFPSCHGPNRGAIVPFFCAVNGRNRPTNIWRWAPSGAGRFYYMARKGFLHGERSGRRGGKQGVIPK